MLVGPPCAALTAVSESGEAFRPGDGSCQTGERATLGSLPHAGYYGFVNTSFIRRPPSDAHIPLEAGRYILLLDVEGAVATATFQLEPNDSPFTAAETARLPRGLTHRYTINPTTLVSVAVRLRIELTEPEAHELGLVLDAKKLLGYELRQRARCRGLDVWLGPDPEPDIFWYYGLVSRDNLRRILRHPAFVSVDPARLFQPVGPPWPHPEPYPCVRR